MKDKRDKIRQTKSAGDYNTGLHDNEERKKEKDVDDIKSARHWMKRLAKRNFHPDGPGGGYEGL